MGAYHTSELAAIFEDRDAITSDGYLRFCESQSNIHCQKRDFLYRGGTWRGDQIDSYLLHRSAQVDSVVLSHSDFSTNRLDVILLNLFGTRAVFAINCSSQQKNCWCLPLGLTNDCDDSPVHRVLGDTSLLLGTLQSIPTRPEFSNSVLLSFNSGTAPRHREKVFSLFVNQTGVTSLQLDYSVSGRREYCELLRRHDFVLCPRGNGRDTHRLWETLYMGSIPIVQKGDLPQSLLTEFPVWIVKSWKEVLDPEMRRQARMNILSKSWDVRKLRQSYWNSFIARHASRESYMGS